jgi:hypothetical protein
MVRATALIQLARSRRRAIRWVAVAVAVGGAAQSLNAADRSGPASRVWLSDLQEQSAEVGSGKLGKNGSYQFTAAGKIKVGGKLSPHGIAAHAPSKVVWNIDKKYKTFRASVALNDTAQNRTRNPIVFAVWGDGVKIWSSRGIRLPGETQQCVVDVAGVAELKLTTTPPSFTDEAKVWAHSVWLEPSLDLEAAPTEGLFPAITINDRRRGAASTRVSNQTLKLLKEDKFAELEQLAERARSNKRLLRGRSEIYYFFSPFDDPEPENEKQWKLRYDQLARWRVAFPQSPLPLLVEARGHISEGWQARGSGWASEVKPEGWKKLQESLATASKCLDAAEKLEPKYSYLYSLRLANHLHNQASEQQTRNELEKGIAIDRQDLDLYDAICQMAQPRWGGRPNQIQAFAAEMQQRFADGWGDQLYAYIAMQHWNDTVEGLSENPAGWDFQKVRPGIIAWAKASPESQYFCQEGCYTACKAGDVELARALMERFGDDDFRLVTWGNFQTLTAWRHRLDPQWPAGEESKRFSSVNDSVMSVDFANDGNWLLIGDIDGNLKVVEIASGKELLSKRLSYLTWMVRTIPGQKKAVVTIGKDDGSEGGQLAAVDLKTGALEVLADIALEYQNLPRQIAMSPDGKWVAASGRKGHANQWPLVDGEIDKEFQLPNMFGVAYSHDGKLLAASSDNGGLWLWNATTGKRQGAPLVVEDKGPLACQLFFAGGTNTLISASNDGTIRRWDVATQKFEVLNPDGPLRVCNAVSPDGRLLASAREHAPWIELYNLATFERIHIFKGHYSDVGDLRFSPDGKLLASGSYDGTARLWDVSPFTVKSADGSDAAK